MKKSKLKTPKTIKISSVIKKLPEELTTVTKLSKSLAMFLFIILPFVGFLLGIRYEQLGGHAKYSNPVEFQYKKVSTETMMCAQDMYTCGDGTQVMRTGPNCEFICPITR